jgi:hypothetical protein
MRWETLSANRWWRSDETDDFPVETSTPIDQRDQAPHQWSTATDLALEEDCAMTVARDLAES